MSRPTVLSLFSGIGGFDLGLERAGFEVVGQCDNDPFCNKVLAKHWPEVRRYDDVRSVGESTGRAQADEDRTSADGGRRQAGTGLPDDLAIVCGGFPCQDLSVAGKRAGLAGGRSGLWFEFHRILSELRPTFCIVENVPGLLSSNKGRDFAVLLSGLGQLWPAVGWAILDSQHFGVPQRRRRVYVIGGPSRACVQQILSLCEGGDWHPASGRAAGQDVAPTLRAGANQTGGHRPPGTDVDTVETLQIVANTLRAQPNASHKADNDTYIPSLSPALAARDYKSTREDVAEPAYVAHTLRADGFDASEDGTGRGTPIVAIQERAGADEGSGPGGKGWRDDGMAYTLEARHHVQAVAASTVRRLTPVECERLQGFPDDWTKLDENTPDGPRYKACGNAVSVPVIEYLGRRIMAVLS